MGSSQSTPDQPKEIVPKGLQREVVVIPVDPSRQAEAAFEWYAKHVYDRKHKVQVLYCQEPIQGNPYYPEHTFKRYRAHAHKSTNKVHIIHCQEIEHPAGENYPDYAVAPESWAEQFEKAKSAGKDLVEKYETKLKNYGMEGSVSAEVGRPGELIVKSAHDNHASQIVMGTRGYGIVRRTILGSVSEYVIHHSNVPVTVVPKETQSWFF
ncbi:DgyrCDS10393 [Dimorphilus gyrociliatus]|uniref:DgyrCDS10393 n=1 Tax=Dimorphilus gyrociliatus TaxID=2664684 RepID=A0A7I8W220_9ANNE|nr:DgyrCDS10393 [Dimorphilus gyrociliatus]